MITADSRSVSSTPASINFVLSPVVRSGFQARSLVARTVNAPSLPGTTAAIRRKICGSATYSAGSDAVDRCVAYNSRELKDVRSANSLARVSSSFSLASASIRGLASRIRCAYRAT
jgi:hypothetical protein